METFVHRTRIPAPAEEVFRWHEQSGAFERLTPPWEDVEVVHRDDGIRDGARVHLRVKMGPTKVKWLLEHRDYIPGRQFKDVQIEGPFGHWEHAHLMEPDGPKACFLEDRVEYELPGGALGRFFGASAARSRLERMFDYRHRTILNEMTER